jgi:hypothetical protein
MQIEIITAKKKLTSSIIKQLPLATKEQVADVLEQNIPIYRCRLSMGKSTLIVYLIQTAPNTYTVFADYAWKLNPKENLEISSPYVGKKMEFTSIEELEETWAIINALRTRSQLVII